MPSLGFVGVVGRSDRQSVGAAHHHRHPWRYGDAPRAVIDDKDPLVAGQDGV